MKIAVMQWICILHLLQKQSKLSIDAWFRRSGRSDIVAVQQSIAKTVQQFVTTKLEHVLPLAPHWISERSDFFGRQSITSQVDNSGHFLPLFLSPLSGPLQVSLLNASLQAACHSRRTSQQLQPHAILLMQLNEKKAAGHDGICPKELKVVANNIAWHFATLFNESLEAGEIPSDFKVGNTKLLPICKPGKKDVTGPENFGGI